MGNRCGGSVDGACGTGKMAISIEQLSAEVTTTRYKYTDSSKYKDYKGKFKSTNREIAGSTDGADLDEFSLDDAGYDTIANNAMRVQKRLHNEQNVFIIQPYIKWGPKKSSSKSEHQLAEAEALVRSIPKWTVEYTLKVPLESLDKKHLFGVGKLEEIKMCLQNLQTSGTLITCVFVSKGTLYLVQKQILEEHFKLPVMDRYSVVIQILRLHAISTEAKLQVAMAEIPYIWNQMKDQDSISTKSRIYLTESQMHMLSIRERKLKNELASIRSHRDLLRNRRKQNAYPIVAVVGYTNAGKISLIKAFTEEKSLEPRNQLFATLGVTAHAGWLPCKLEVLFMDTVGFMADIPTGLILQEIERQILVVTGRQKLIIRVPMGGQEVAWLYKNAAVTETAADPRDSQRLLVGAVITEAKLQQFRHLFV
ncbi:putative GTP-binding protein 6 [Sabethes cyaneus]|uniref:putative GTP-binding protein 6 n=1 Tax=Sabethes cyaneus TaxID=53552 RepID=UPI00237DA501|nr:putative GTP-binding protein 6 [Sabethes cyaneus]